MQIAVNIISVQIAWAACAYGAIAGLPIIGVLGCMMALGLGVALSSQRDTLIYLSVLLGLYGLATESILASSGVIRYGAPGPFSEIAPVWIVTLWMAFSVLIFPAFKWFIGRPIAASVLGGTMAPFSYLAADRLGALRLSEPVLAFFAIAVIWAVALPLAIHVRTVLARRQ